LTAIDQMHKGLQHDMDQRQKDASASKTESRERLLEDLRADQEQIEMLLNRDQLTRLKQIVLQARQPFSFNDREVVETLSLSADQQRQINNIIDQEWSNGPGVGLPPDSEGKSSDIHGLRPAEPGRGLPRPGGPLPEGPPDGHPPRGPRARDGRGPDGFHPKGPPPPDELGLGPGAEEFGRGRPPRCGISIGGPFGRTGAKPLE